MILIGGGGDQWNVTANVAAITVKTQECWLKKKKVFA